MLYSNFQHLEDKIVQILIDKQPCSAKELGVLLKTESRPYSFQGIYKSLNNLLLSETLLKQGKRYLINEEWREGLIKKLSNNSPIELVDGEKMKYELGSLIHLDLQWKNVVLPLHKKYPLDPIFFYNYHYILILLSDSRKQSESEYCASFAKNKTWAFFLIGSNTSQDRAAKKLVANEYFQVATGREPSLAKTGYVTVFNDYVITTQLSTELIKKIEACYQKTDSLIELEQAIRKLGIEKRRVQLIIERNKEKAKVIRKKLAPDFHIPKELREKFELF